MDEQLDRRLGEIEKRLRHIESHIGLDALPMAVPVTPVIPPTRSGPPPLPNMAIESPEAVAARVASDRYAANMRAAYDGGPPEPATSPVEAVPMPRPIAPPPLRTPSTSSSTSIEQTIGLKWTGWIGAIVLIIGLALGYKFAYDQGWLKLAPIPKLILMVASGFALLGAGEVVFRRINRLSAAGLYGAGVAVLFLTIYAGQAWYGLFGLTIGLLLLTGTAAIGMGIAARANLVSVAALAVLGATVGPLCMGADAQMPRGYYVYLLAVQGLAIGLCAWRATPRWWVLRGLSLVMITIAAGAAGGLDATLGHFNLSGVIFVLVSAILFQGELILTTYRRQPGTPGEATRGATFSLLSTAVLTVELLLFFHYQPPTRRGEVLLWMAGTAAILGRLLARRTLGTTLLGRGYYVQAGLLLTLAIPVLLHGPTMLFGWMTFAVALAILAGRTRDRVAIIGAAFVWTLAVIVWAMWSNFDEAARHVWINFAGQPLQASVCVALCLAISGHIIAAVIHHFRRDARAKDRQQNGFGFVFDIAAVLVFGAALLNDTRPAFATWTLIAYAWALLGLSSIGLLTHLGTVAIAVIGLTAVKWLTMDLILPRLTPGWTPEPGVPFFNVRVAVGYVLAASTGVIGWIVGKRQIDAASPQLQRRTDALLSTVLTIAVLMLGVALSFEIDLTHSGRDIDRHLAAAQVALLQTILWCALAIAWVLTLRQSLRSADVLANVKRIAIAAALILTAKFVAIDLLSPFLDNFRPAMPVGFNLQVLTAVVVGFTLCLTASLDRTSTLSGYAAFAVPVLIWVTGTAEIDRYAVLQHAGPTWIVRQVGWSIYWSALAVVTLIVGFAWHWKSLRYASLGLLAVTLLKVTLIDLSGAGTGWRILSFLGLGLLLLATSVLYGKFSLKPSTQNSPPE